MKEQHKIEKKKYLDCFKNGTIEFKNGTTHSLGQYGEGNHGERAQTFFIDASVKSLIDVGAGQGNFVNNLVELSNSLEKVYALDIASVTAGVNKKHDKITWIDAMAHDVPLDDNSVEWVTSFDCLEHCLPEDVDTICSEFYRICTEGALVKISYRGCMEQSKIRDELPEEHKDLHLSIYPKEEWINRFRNAGFSTVEEYNDSYLIFRK